VGLLAVVPSASPWSPVTTTIVGRSAAHVSQSGASAVGRGDFP
jgi:hypothetical protein